MESALVIFMNEDSECFWIFPMHRSLTRGKKTRRGKWFFRVTEWAYGNT